MSNARSPIFLSGADEPRHRVRCPIHGFIHYSENERHVIDHRLFQRLRYIRQLALTEFLYPGANHTRFEHSLGVMEVATRAFDALAIKHGAKMESTFQEVEQLKENTMAKARQFLRLAALLHDVGHAAFSHAAESVVQKDAKHEALSVRVIQQPEYLGDFLHQTFGEECPEVVTWLIESNALPPQLRVVRDLISGQMDADRTDYLLRDAHHCGVEYGRFDYLRMIECLDLYDNEFGGIDLALQHSGIHTLEALTLARYQMNTQVYYHRIRRIYDLYLVEYHKALGEEFTEETILKNNDMTMMARIMTDAQNPELPQYKWARRIIERDHHREIFSTPVTESWIMIQRAQQLEKNMKLRYTGSELLFDTAEGNIHKLLRADDEKNRDWVRLYLTGAGRHPRLVTEVSQVLSKIPRGFLCARIFAASPEEDKEKIEKLKEAAKTEWQGLQ